MEFMVRLEKSEPAVANETVAFPGALTEAIAPPVYVTVMLLPKSSVIDERYGFPPYNGECIFYFSAESVLGADDIAVGIEIIFCAVFCSEKKRGASFTHGNIDRFYRQIGGFSVFKLEIFYAIAAAAEMEEIKYIGR